jgi:mRNA interferase RelE/StbE
VYEVYVERTAESDLKRLPTNSFQRIIFQIRTLAENPRPSGCRKLTGSKNDWRIRIGDYHVLYEIDERAKAVKFGVNPKRVGQITDAMSDQVNESLGQSMSRVW